jgi:hypothetical protein
MFGRFHPVAGEAALSAVSAAQDAALIANG